MFYVIIHKSELYQDSLAQITNLFKENISLYFRPIKNIIEHQLLKSQVKF
jgi:hypothetical protein